ncbi:hypothetical protein Apa02nite_037950 [Actinoplanes palleronii]|uniref:Type VII secretion protein EccE n=2 Tax=Actinoplanes palleronii TaxID=113570 RepID=A0ABQ4BAE5_9ACTN|nr:hypothetical protein Apa02nite_037950 [Actinoplanes palleronii]
MSGTVEGAAMATTSLTGAPTVGPDRSHHLGLHQVLATQAAAVLALIGAAAGGPARLAAVVCAPVLLALTWLRFRDRWAFQQLTAVLHFRARRRSDGRQGSATVLALVAPETRITSIELPAGPAAVFADGAGLTALLDLGDPAALLAESRPELPAPWELLPADGRERPPVRIQLLLTAVPAPAGPAGNDPAAGSYRMLTGGRALGHARALLAVRVARTDGWSDRDLHRALTGQARKLTKRLKARPLDRTAAVRAMTDFAYAEPAAEVHEQWTSLRVGELSQVTFHGRTRPGECPSADLLTHLLHLPTTATTLTLTAALPATAPVTPTPATRSAPARRSASAAATSTSSAAAPELGEQPRLSLAIRLAAPEPAALEPAINLLRQLAAGEHLHLRRRDGDHLPGLAATLPLAASDTAGLPSGHRQVTRTVPGRRTHPDALSRPGDPRSPAEGFGRLALPTDRAGLVVGHNRHGQPVLIRPFRPDHTRVVLVGGLRCAQVVTFRAMALGARVLVRTYRPRAWEPFARGTAAPSGSITLKAPDQPVEAPPSSPLCPLLIILDLGPLTPAPPVFATPLPAGPVQPGVETRLPLGVTGIGHAPAPLPAGATDAGPWRATLSLREECRAADVAAANDADLLLLQTLRPDEAHLIGAALELGDTAPLLTRMRPGMLAVINRQAVRWAMLAPTSVEKVLIGDSRRSADER